MSNNKIKYWFKSLFLLLFSVMLLTGCGSSAKQDDLLNYINKELPKVVDLEERVTSSWEAVSGDNFKDDFVLYEALDTKIIPDTLKLVDIAESIVPKEQELKNIHEIYISGVNLQLQAFTTILAALERQDNHMVSKANEKLAETRKRARDYANQLKEYAKKNNVEIK